MTQGFEKLLEVITSGFLATINLSSILAFVVMFFFVMHMAVGQAVSSEYKNKNIKSEIFWGFFSSLSSFLLVGVFLLLIHTPLTGMAVYDHFMWGLNLGQFMTLISLFGWLLLAGYLFIPVQEKKKASIEDEDDISFVPFVSVFFGFCLAILTFIDTDWPNMLMKLVTTTELLGQASFYGFIFILPFIIIWGGISLILSLCTRKLFENIIPKIVPVFLLAVTFVYQLVFQYL